MVFDWVLLDVTDEIIVFISDQLEWNCAVDLFYYDRLKEGSLKKVTYNLLIWIGFCFLIFI